MLFVCVGFGYGCEEMRLSEKRINNHSILLIVHKSFFKKMFTFSIGLFVYTVYEFCICSICILLSRFVECLGDYSHTTICRY